MRRSGFQESIQVMNVELRLTSIVQTRGRHCVVVYGPMNSGVVDFVSRGVQLCERRGSYEVGYFVHVYPEAIKWQCSTEDGDLLAPEFRSGRVQEIGEVDWARPYFAEVVGSIPFYKNLSFQSSLECRISGVHADTYEKKKKKKENFFSLKNGV